MPTFVYDGKTLRVDHLYSYGRVSADQETIKSGGESLPRQLEMHTEFAAEFAIPTEDLDGTQLQFLDDGKSGSKGEHLRDGAGLAAFMSVAKAGKLKSYPGLTVESFTRLGRLPTNRAHPLFWEIINAGVVLFTLKDRRAYTIDSINKDKGQIYQVSAMMQAAHAYAEDLAYYGVKSWAKRRGTPTGGTPTWFDKFAQFPGTAEPVPVVSFKGLPKGAVPLLKANADKHALIQRIFAETLHMGVNRLAVMLNAEGKPLFSGGKGGWNQSCINTMIRSRMALGEQRLSKYVDGVRTFTGEIIKDAYPAVVTEEQWKLANAELDRRSRGGQVGRNVEKAGNLFGETARCAVCQGRMCIKQKGRIGEFKYFGCSNAKSGQCTAKGYHRLDHVEAWLLGFLREVRAVQLWTPKPKPQPIDPTMALNTALDRAKAKAVKLLALMKASKLSDDPSEPELYREYSADRAKVLIEIKQLEHDLNSLKSAEPVQEQIAVVSKLAGVLDGLKGDALTEARQDIARLLPTILPGGLRFKAGGGFSVHPHGYSIHFPKLFTPEMLNDWDSWVEIREDDPDDHLSAEDYAA